MRMLIENTCLQKPSYDELQKAFLYYQQEIEAKEKYFLNYKTESEITIQNLEKRLEQYRLAYEQMQHQINELARHRFGSKSERFNDEASGQLVLPFFNDSQKAPLDLPSETPTTVAAHTRSHQKKKHEYPRVIEIIPVSDADKQCVCGCQKTVIRYEIKELFDYQPAIPRKIEQRREVVACQKGCEGSVMTAPAPKHILPKVRATEALLAHLVVTKLHDRQPLYHLEKYHFDISRETMARWVIQLQEPLQPVFNLLKDEVIAYDIASVDATTLQVLREPGRRAQTKSYAYCMRGGTKEHAVILYGYNDEDHQRYVDQWFEGFAGYAHMDADSFFNDFTRDENVQAALCNAHARRKFEAVKKQAQKQGLAHEALRFYKKLYEIERRAKELNLSAEERYHLRQTESKPLLDTFKKWLEQHDPSLLPTSPLGKAFRYCLKHWEGLVRFLEDGRLEIDNNLTEQEIKPFVIARKNFMFATSTEGAHALCLHFSLIRTAIAHKLNPYEYYVALLKRIPHCTSVEDYEQLLPWNFKNTE